MRLTSFQTHTQHARYNNTRKEKPNVEAQDLLFQQIVTRALVTLIVHDLFGNSRPNIHAPMPHTAAQKRMWRHAVTNVFSSLGPALWGGKSSKYRTNV